VAHLTEILHSYFANYGYWTIAFALLLENAGVPMPGETVLLYASFLASSQHHLRLPYIVVVGTLAAAAGDNLGYALGRWGGRWLLDRYRAVFRIEAKMIARGELLFDRYGPAAVLLARFIFGMRVIAGPLAGVLRMHWKRFAVFNVLGAATWVVTVASLGYTFGKHWDRLVPLFHKVDAGLGAAAAAAAVWLWWKYRRNGEQSAAGQQGE
jgi:membrane protein DedA with SNARE-associated domain